MVKKEWIQINEIPKNYLIYREKIMKMNEELLNNKNLVQYVPY